MDEAWTTGTQLGEAVLELLREGKPFTQENLAVTYEARRRNSWVERGAREAENARNGFHSGIVRGLFGMALAGLTRGRLALRAETLTASRQIRPFATDSTERRQLKKAAELASTENRSLHDALLTVRGWPEIPYDGRLLVTQQDALLIGGKVQAMPGFADHVHFIYPDFCESCISKMCIEMCSGQALLPGPGGVPAFDREKCVHCGACLWNCVAPLEDDPLRSNISFRAGAGGLHSAEN